ncbi:hypothetical protein V6N13_037770 [Hibiscus sabdariffa]
MKESPILIWNSVLKESEEFINVTTANTMNTRTTSAQMSWSPPPLNSIKINCDASFEKNRNFAGIAVVARNSYGVIVDGINAQVPASSTLAAECLALRLGSHLIERHGWQHVFLESDCKLAIEMINSLTPVYWEAKAIVSDIRKIVVSFPNVCLSYVGRLSNYVADWVAKATIKGTCPSNWMRQIPDDLFQMM